MRARTAFHSVLAVGLAFGTLVGACGSDPDGSTPSDGGVPDASNDTNDAGTPGDDAGPHDLHPTFTFESGPVRPVALSPDGTTLFVANTPNASLDIFKVTATGLTPAGSVSVGLDPVAVAARTSTEVWVVNHISDSVSIVDTSVAPHVVRTLLVGGRAERHRLRRPRPRARVHHHRASRPTAHRPVDRQRAGRR